MEIEQASAAAVADLWAEVEPGILTDGFLEEGAQALATALHGRFEESVVIARVFITVPFAQLPETNQRFARGLVESAGAVADLTPTTPVLSLVGSYGREQRWQDRRRSTGHVGIPIVSASFVSTIPMISRLLNELGVPVAWVDSHDSGMIVDTISHEAGLFYVENAATATDGEGRSIIADQDFVSDYGVQSVFGCGGAYSTGQIAILLVFCRGEVPRVVAERFVTLTAFFISKTTEQVEQGRILSD